MLSPLAMLYGSGIYLRNYLYKNGILQSAKFDLPIISVGNLTVGGTGKTPHVEFLVRHLRQYLKVATLSRGYKRSLPGFLVVHPQHSAKQVGDEPIQFKRKFPDIMVAVSEDRVFAIPKMLMIDDELKVVVLDDAFQHRALSPGLNILLTEYGYPFFKDYLLPAGRLREHRSGVSRADVIIASKCPIKFTEADRKEFLGQLKPEPHQAVYFSYFVYGTPYHLFDGMNRLVLNKEIDVLLISAVARPEYLVDYLEMSTKSVLNMEYADHHLFTKPDIGRLFETFEKMDGENKIIITTEKDAVRLYLHQEFIHKHQLPVYVLPVEVVFHFNEDQKFQKYIEQFLLDFKI